MTYVNVRVISNIMFGKVDNLSSFLSKSYG